MTRALPFAGLLTLLLPVTGHAQEAVVYKTRDGGVIQANTYGSGRNALVLAHGGRFNKESWAAQIPAFVAAGFKVLALDFRGYGKSRAPGDADPMSAPLHEDVLGAVRHLRAQGARSVSVLGASMGGGAAAGAVRDAKPGEIDRLVLLASDWIDAPEKLTPPTLFVVARGDLGSRGAPRLERIQQHYSRAPGPKALLVVEGSAHAQAIFGTPEGDRTLREIIRFLSAR